MRSHLLSRLLNKDYAGDEDEYTPEQLGEIIIQKNRMYSHQIVNINYTTYDVRRGQDIIHVGTDRTDIMMLACEEEDGTRAHPYWYARVVGAYHVNVKRMGAGGALFTRMDFLHVRWFGRDFEWAEQNPSSRLVRVGWDTEHEYGFVDPAHVVRACHVIPAFAADVAPSRYANSFSRGPDYNEYYVMRLVVRSPTARRDA